MVQVWKLLAAALEYFGICSKQGVVAWVKPLDWAWCLTCTPVSPHCGTVSASDPSRPVHPQWIKHVLMLYCVQTRGKIFYYGESLSSSAAQFPTVASDSCSSFSWQTGMALYCCSPSGLSFHIVCVVICFLAHYGWKEHRFELLYPLCLLEPVWPGTATILNSNSRDCFPQKSQDIRSFWNTQTSHQQPCASQRHIIILFVCSVECSDSVYTEASGLITSADFPKPYPKSSDCLYRIKLEKGFSVTLEFDDTFDIEDHPDVTCPYDHIKVRIYITSSRLWC